MSERKAKAFPACLVGKPVEIEWLPAAGEDADWTRFRVVRESHGWLLLLGLEQGGAQHGGRIWVPLRSIASISVSK